MSDAQTKPERPKPDPKALTPEYHKARKQLMLWSAILFIWELVGIDVEKAKEAGGNAGAIAVALKSPQAVPWVFLILVLYFAFKLRTEWLQCNKTRREVREAKQDYYLAFIVASAASALYLGQTIWRVQIANRIGSSGSAVLALIMGTILLALFSKGSIGLIVGVIEKRRVGWLHPLQLLFGIVMVFVVLTTMNFPDNPRFLMAFIMDVIGALLLCWPWLYSLRLRRAFTRRIE